jgi:hypothetical protein
MKLAYLQAPTESWNEEFPRSKTYPRNWVTITDIEVTLSDGYVLKIPDNTIWDGASIPKWLWWLMKPIDEGALGDLIHDQLWVDKRAQFEFFEYDIHAARKFADEERLRWREALAPRKTVKNIVTHRVIRLIGGLYYSKQIQIPN